MNHVIMSRLQGRSLKNVKNTHEFDYFLWKIAMDFKAACEITGLAVTSLL
jgi:hypothetical protein